MVERSDHRASISSMSETWIRVWGEEEGGGALETEAVVDRRAVRAVARSGGGATAMSGSGLAPSVAAMPYVKLGLEFWGLCARRR
jgi:hypothetical protein